MSSENEFEQGDSGDPTTYLAEAGRMHPGSLIIIMDQYPCRVTFFSTVKRGKHGHEKAMIYATDIFTGEQFQAYFGTYDMIPAPIVTKIEVSVASYDDDGVLTLMNNEGELKEDLNLPTEAHLSDIATGIKKIIDAGQKECLVTYQRWGDKEQVVAVREGAEIVSSKPVDKPVGTYLPSDNYLGWVQGSENGVDVEIIFDYMDPVSRRVLTQYDLDDERATIFEMFNGTTLHTGGFLIDHVHLRLVGVPVEYEIDVNNEPICHVFYYIKDQCENDGPCYYNEYLELAFAKADKYDEEKKDGQDYAEWWSGVVASKFGFDFDDVFSIWNPDDDPRHEEEAFDYHEDAYLYGVKKASGQIPAVYVDGERQELIPQNIAEWHALLSRYVEHHTSYELPLIAEDCMASDLPDCTEDDGEETEEEGEEGPMD